MTCGYDLVVVGAGIVGATVGKAAGATGRSVLLLDAGRDFAGTAPSGGHLKPSWFGGLPKNQYQPAMDLLAETWGLSEEKFGLQDPIFGKVIKYATVFRVDTDVVAAHPRTFGEVTSVTTSPGRVTTVYRNENNTEVVVTSKSVVLAAGGWCNELLNCVPDLKVKQGVSFRLAAEIKEPIIRPWAPYKQIVVHQQTASTVWAGDGSALYPSNWTGERTAECLGRCLKPLGHVPVVETRVGYRPYCKTTGTDPCYLARPRPGLWVATGAGKSGTIAAGWAAVRILQQLPG